MDKDNAKKIEVTAGKIDFKDVNFSYINNQQIVSSAVFNSLNLRVGAGERVGIVGRSGAGKSTLINLLLRFYDIDKGAISIDDQDIKTVQQESLRENIAVVTQDTSLLHRSVRENILFGRPDALSLIHI